VVTTDDLDADRAQADLSQPIREEDLMNNLASQLLHRPQAELGELIAGVRGAVSRHADWRETAVLVADELRRHLPSPDVLTAEQRAGDPDGYRSHVLHVEPDGTFSVIAIVWRPGQVTRIHDHVTWCVFGVIEGVEYEELFTYDEADDCLVEAGANANATGEVSGFAPPGDIHRVRNVGDETAISVHIYGTDLSRVGSSVRRYYDLPVRPASRAR
jgi:predicted metal-dependent enzyme (double-stranded beta helix superfamily)